MPRAMPANLTARRSRKALTTMDSERELIDGFLYREARLMDGNAYDDWLSLWTDDALYSIPCNSDDADPSHHVMIVYDDRRMLEERIMRLKSGFARSQQP